MTSLNQLRRFDPRLERDQLITQVGELAGERGAGLDKQVDQLVPAVGANRLVIPRVQRAEVRYRNAVNGGDDGAYPSGVERDIGAKQIDPLVHPDLLACDGREHA